jgi:TRAP-type transport system small permease protein
MVRHLLAISRGLERILGWATVVLVVLILAIVSGQFVDRHLVDLPWDAPDQLARICIIWLTFLGTALALSEGTSIRIDLIDHILPPRMIAWRDRIFDIVLLVLLVVISIKGWSVVQVGASQLLLGTPFTADLPYAGLFAGVVLASIFVAIRLVRRVVEGLSPNEERL